MKAEEFDRLFDEGKDISHLFDWNTARRPGLEIKRVNVDYPNWMVNRIDREARRLGITRQSLIKVWTETMIRQVEHV